MGKVAKVLIGAAAGFVAGILIAPKSGKETRKDIKKKVDDVKGQADQKIAAGKVAAKESAESVKAGAKKVEKEARGMAKSAKNSGKVIRDEAGRLTDEAKVRASRVAGDAKTTAKAVKRGIKRNVN